MKKGEGKRVGMILCMMSDLSSYYKHSCFYSVEAYRVDLFIAYLYLNLCYVVAIITGIINTNSH